jgi:hypothetical protein
MASLFFLDIPLMQKLIERKDQKNSLLFLLPQTSQSMFA